uniref:Uncharacterized protein n=1 Tax=Salix viminalis TaxID=40686 RepID=A0A6N2LGQ8_SALVM
MWEQGSKLPDQKKDVAYNIEGSYSGVCPPVDLCCDISYSGVLGDRRWTYKELIEIGNGTVVSTLEGVVTQMSVASVLISMFTLMNYFAAVMILDFSLLLSFGYINPVESEEHQRKKCEQSKYAESCFDAVSLKDREESEQFVISASWKHFQKRSSHPKSRGTIYKSSPSFSGVARCGLYSHVNFAADQGCQGESHAIQS